MGQCLKAGCESEALDGANYCAAHGGDVVHGDMALPRVTERAERYVPTPSMAAKARGASARSAIWFAMLTVVVVIVVWWLMRH